MISQIGRFRTGPDQFEYLVEFLPDYSGLFELFSRKILDNNFFSNQTLDNDDTIVDVSGEKDFGKIMMDQDFLDLGLVDPYVGARKMEKIVKNQMEIWQEELDDRLKGKVIPPKYWEHPELEKGGHHKHCSNCIDLTCKSSFANNACGIIECRYRCGAKFHACKSGEHQ